MSLASKNTADSSPMPTGPQLGARQSTPGFSDGLGDRWVMFEHLTASSLELLRFKPEFSDSPAFEAALRQRIERLKHLSHPSVATVRSVERLEAGHGLALVSMHTPGRRLSDLAAKARGPVFALEFIRHLTPVLAALQQAGEGIAHGVLTAERIVVTLDSRLVVVEHVLGSALESLHLPAKRLRSELGLALPAGSDPVKLDSRTDIMQLGFVALSLLLGRRLDPADCPTNVSALLDEFAETDWSPASSRLRSWLERALQVGRRPFRSAQEACEAFNELPEKIDPQPTEAARTLRAVQTPAAQTAVAPTAPAPTVASWSTAAVPTTAASTAASSSLTATPSTRAASTTTSSTGQRPTATDKVDKGAAATQSGPPPLAAAVLPAARGRRRVSLTGWVATGLAVLALAQTVAIVRLLYAQPTSRVVTAPPPRKDVEHSSRASVPPGVPADPPVTRAPGAESAPAVPAPKPAAVEPNQPATRPAVDPAPAERAAPERFGGMRLSAPIDLQVFEAGKLLGTTAGPIAAIEGSHALDVVNEALGYRAREIVNVKAGQMTQLTVALPNGRVSINAVPWADVWIDGKAAGQTPLANLSLMIGSHEIVFRHPQLGERHTTVLVKPEGMTRVSENFQR